MRANVTKRKNYISFMFVKGMRTDNIKIQDVVIIVYTTTYYNENE